jgi:Zn-dependent protease with chaperone function
MEVALNQLVINEIYISIYSLQPHPFNVFVSYSHPTLLQRLEALDKLEKV